MKLVLPEFGGPVASDVWQERKKEIRAISETLLLRALNDSEEGAILVAGLAESKPLGRDARFIDSVTVLNDDFQLALKIKLEDLQNQVRPLQPPRRRAQPARVLHQPSAAEAKAWLHANARIDELCRQWAAASEEPFVTLVARQGVIITHQGFGVVSNKPVSVDYRCWVGSITKSVTALLFGQFLDQGLLDLDASLATVLPHYEQLASHAPTFRQCFNHTSGLVGHGDFGGVRNPNLENIILNGLDVNKPNAAYAYSGMGYDLAGKAMEIVAGKCAMRLYEEALFRPLRLGDIRIDDASGGGHFTAIELGVLGQMISNRGSYGDLEFMSSATLEQMLPKPLSTTKPSTVVDEGIGLHWIRRLKPNAPPGSTHKADQLFSVHTVGHGSLSGCIFIIDLDHELVIAQVRRRPGPRYAEWSGRFFEAVAEEVIDPD
jgi:CubicO group peptidase (beta-lactamase class C family)